MTSLSTRICFYILLPLLCTASIFAPLLISEKAIWMWAVSPRGFLENITSVFLFVGIMFCTQFLKSVGDNRQLRGWIYLFIAACIYFAGEDQNWGQYWLNFDVPQYFLDNNKEQEFNLHNMGTWFNQKPRLMTEAWALLACVLVPFGWAWPKRASARVVPAVLWPDTKWMSPVVAMIFLVGFVEIVGRDMLIKYGVFEGGVRLSEVQEMLIGYLLMLYAVHLCERTESAPATAAAASRA